MIDIKKANQQALKTLLEAKPMWVDIQKAIDIVPGMKKNLLLHAGPPVTWEKMCGPQRGAVIAPPPTRARRRTRATRITAKGPTRCH